MSAALRQRRAAVAARLQAGALRSAAALDWTALGQAPDWLALPEADFARLPCRVGAVQCAGALRLWIDRPRLAAAEAALGAAFHRALRAQPEAAAVPLGLVHCPEIAAAAQVAPVLRAAGAAVLLASLPPGALRDAVAEMLQPPSASAMSAEFAATLVSRTLALAQQADAALPTEAA